MLTVTSTAYSVNMGLESYNFMFPTDASSKFYVIMKVTIKVCCV